MKTPTFPRPILLALAILTLSPPVLHVWTRAESEPFESPERFTRFEIDIGIAERQSVLAGNFLGHHTADLAVVNVENDGQRRLRIFPLSSQQAPPQEGHLGSDVSFIDGIQVGEQDHLLTYQSGHLRWHDLRTGSSLGELPLPSSFIPPRSNEVPHVDISHDVNDDGLADIVMPDEDGFWIITQGTNGSFGLPIKINRPTDLSGIYGSDGYRYNPWSQSRIYKIDFNHDGRNDLVYWREQQFHVHLQNTQGFFAAKPVQYPSPQTIQTDDLYVLSRDRMVGRALHSIADLNADGIPDLVVQSLQGQRLSKKESRFEIHLGKKGKDSATAFQNIASLSFRSKGNLQLSMQPHDFDNDGQTDLVFTCIERTALKGSLWKTLKGMMGDDIRLQIEFYRMEDGQFANRPNAIRTLALDGVPSPRERGSIPLEIALRGATHEKRRTQTIWPRAFNTLLRLGDINGDGLADLIRSSHPRQLGIQFGTLNGSIFSEPSESIKVDMPNDEEYVQLLDLNRDAKLDLLLHRPYVQRDAHGARLFPPSLASQQIIVLLAK